MHTVSNLDSIRHCVLTSVSCSFVVNAFMPVAVASVESIRPYLSCVVRSGPPALASDSSSSRIRASRTQLPSSPAGPGSNGDASRSLAAALHNDVTTAARPVAPHKLLRLSAALHVQNQQRHEQT